MENTQIPKTMCLLALRLNLQIANGSSMPDAHNDCALSHLPQACDQHDVLCARPKAALVARPVHQLGQLRSFPDDERPDPFWSI
jgi:hypothetical protein